MTLGRAIEKRLCIQHAMSGHAIYSSAQTRIRNDAFTHVLPPAEMCANVLSLRKPGADTRERPKLKIPMPANDNLVPLT